jgi:hypothetical protein
MSTTTQPASPQPTVTRRSLRDYTLPIVLGAAGLILILAKLILPGLSDVFYRASLSQVEAVCNSPLGALVSGDKAVAHACSQAQVIDDVLTLGLFAGLILAGWAAWITWKRYTAGR